VNPTEILTHAADARARLLEQYKGKLNIEALLDIESAFVQELEGVFFDLLLDSLATAQGAQLDGYGAIVGQERGDGENDGSYLISIRTKIIENLSQGEPERIIAVAKVLIGADRVYLSELFPAGIGISVDVTLGSQELVNIYFRRIERIVAATVRVEYLASFDPANAFTFEGDPIGAGFGDLDDPSVGGPFAELYLESSDFAFAGGSDLDEGFGDTQDVLVGGGFVDVA
jgi:hypothetical protein